MREVLELDLNNVDDQVTAMALQSVISRTFGSHISHFNNLYAYALEKNICDHHPVSDEVLCRFIADPKFNMMNTSIDAMKSAVNFFLRCTGERGPALRTEAVVKGRQMTNNPGMKAERGAVVKANVDQMLKDDIPQLYKDCFVIMSAIRQGQLQSLRLSRFKFDTNITPKSWVVTVDKHFKGKKGLLGGQATMEEHVCNPAWNKEIADIVKRLTARKNGCNPDPVIGHGFKPAQGLSYLKGSAFKHQWGDLEWVLHGLRHGSAVDAFYDFGEKSAVEGMKAAQARTKHATFEMLAYYTRDNVERMYVVRSQQAAIMSRNTSLNNRTRLFKVKLGDGIIRRKKHGNMVTNTVQRRTRKDFKLQQQQATTKSGRQQKNAEAALKNSIADGKKKAKKAAVTKVAKR